MRLSNRNPFLSVHDKNRFSSYGKGALIWLKKEDEVLLRKRLGPNWKAKIYRWAGSCTACGDSTQKCLGSYDKGLLCTVKNCDRFKDTRVRR